MKKIKRLAIVTVFGLGVCGLAIAQVHRSGALDDGAQHHGDAAAGVKHLGEVFPQIAAFDANKNGKLDAAERETLAKAIADGTLQLPAHTPPHGDKRTPGVMLTHIAEMYAHVAPYDANHNGALDATEQAAIKSAMEKGEFAPHGQHHGEADGSVKHLSEVFPQVASFDANKDGKLDSAEKQGLGKAIADGKLQLPAHTPSHGEKPTAETMLNHIGEMYAHVSTYDANRDGKLDEKEQATLKADIDKGEFAPHEQHSRDGGGHHR